jgi:Flp pilus assembly protein TadG
LRTRHYIPNLGDTHGQSLVEFSLCVFLIVMLMIGVVEIGRMIIVYTTISNAARAGARYAIVNGSHLSTSDPAATVTSTGTQVQSVVTNYLGAAPMTSGNATTNVTYGGGSDAIGSTVTVQVTYPYDPFTSYFPLTVNLGSTSQGVIAY